MTEKTYHILLTGASGYLGQHILHTLLLNHAAIASTQNNNKNKKRMVVCALYHRASGFQQALENYLQQQQWNEDDNSKTLSIQCHALDFTNETAITEFFTTSSSGANTIVWDFCIHTAAMASPKDCQENPDRAMTINNPTYFFQALQQHNPTIRLVALSTDQVYEGIHPPYDETSPTVPVNVYGKTKRAMEIACCETFFSLTAIVLRSSILLGPPAPLSMAHDTFLQFVNSRPPPYQTTYWINERRNVLAVQDAVHILLKVALDDTTIVGIYNMGGPVSYSRMELAQAVFAHQNYDPLDALQPAIKVNYHHHQQQQQSPGKIDIPSPLDITMSSTQLLQKLKIPIHTLKPLSEIVALAALPMVSSNSTITKTDDTTTNTIIIQGFHDIYHEINNPTGRLIWRYAPDSWSKSNNDGNNLQKGREGCDGSWFVTNHDQQQQQLIVYPAAKKDYWRKTYYEPLLVKDDGAVLEYCNLQSQHYYTVSVNFDLVAKAQFDQAGIFIRFDSEHWIKTGIEVVDGLPRLSCVVTNEYSDWSTQPWNHYQKQTTVATSEQQKQQTEVLVSNMNVRVHCRGTSFVVEAKLQNHHEEWDFIRIAHLQNTAETFAAGVFACCPEDQKGGYATFHDFRIMKGSYIEHNADGNHET